MAIFEYRGKNIFYKIVESKRKEKGTPLLMLNGIMMSTDSWAMFKSSLSQNRDLILVDFVDQGRSDAYSSDNEDVYDHSLQIDLVIELLEYLKIEKVNLFGISYGGLIALQIALQRADLVERLLLFNTAAYTTPWLRDIGNGWNAAASTDDPNDYYHVAIPYIYSHSFYNGSHDWMMSRKEDLLKIFTREFKDRMIRLTRSSEGYDIRESLHSIEIPTVIVCSEFDYLTPKSESYYLKEHIKNSVLFELKGTGHASMYEKPDEFLILIEGFLGYTKV